jgi:uncharacterized protein with FMN-binding domain
VKRAVAALLSTAVAVVLLARYETHPPAKPPPPARRAAVPAPPKRNLKVGTGPLLTTPFSSIQVRAEVSHGRLVGVETLSLTGADAHTQDINARAEPILRREALRAGTADIDTVSGATYTSESWIESLRAAMRVARGA